MEIWLADVSGVPCPGEYRPAIEQALSWARAAANTADLGIIAITV